MTKLLATREAYGDVLVELGAQYEDIVVLTADLAGSTKVDLFGKKYPQRFFNMGISEQDMMGTAAGMAVSGKIPFVSTFAIFATGRAFEQVRQSIAYPNFNVKIVVTHGGITVGEDGGSHQTVEDIAIMRCLPNMKVILPADAIETKEVIKVIASEKGPFYVRLSRSKFPVVYDNGCKYKLGKADILREGTDVTFVCCGFLVAHALEAAQILSQEGIEAVVVNSSSIKPLDAETIVALAHKTGAVVTAEEHSILGGLGGAVCEVLAERAPVPVERIGVRDVFGVSGSSEDLIRFFGLEPIHLVQAARRAMAHKKGGYRS